MANEIEPPEPDLSNIRKHLGNNRPLLRVFGWGSAAAFALAILAVATQTEIGSERLQLAFAPEVRPAPVLAEVAPPKIEKDAETRALEAQLRELAADRDRLSARVASLERSLDDVTGSIKRQAMQETAAAAATQPVMQQAAAPASPPAPAKIEPPIIEPLAMPALGTESNAAWPETSSPQAAATEAVPLPPVRTASLPTNEAAAEPARKPEIGVDIGGAPNMEVLTLRWAAVKANFGPLLTGLHPLAARVHRQSASTSDVRLLIGPLPSMVAAAQLCSRFTAARVTCRPVKFEGERLAQR